ncbi:MAG: UbiA prenyltransferase family protein [Candidatus Zixiibacteriota bacterium]|nr:MAG: UbiA prenyltransferase family protein [candidate division Zixibacteria bacterium]
MRIIDYIFAARPMLHLPVWSIYLVSLHYHHRLSGDRFLWTDLFILACLTLMGAAACYINQVYDCESDRVNRKVGFLQNDILTEKNIKVMFVSVSAIAAGAAALISALTFFIMLLLFVLGYLYSAPPWRLKDRAVGGFAVNAFGIGFVVPMLVMPDISFHNAGLLGWDNPFYFFLTVGGIYLLTTLPDREGDERIGKKTPAVIFPRVVVVIAATVFMLLSGWVAFYSGHILLMYLSLVAVVTTVLMLFVRGTRYELFAAKLPILLLTLLAGYFFWGYILFIVAIIFSTRIYYRKRFAITYPELA